MPNANREPYGQTYYPPTPTGFTRYMRNSLPWQFIRFIVINVKMLRLMMNSQHSIPLRKGNGAGQMSGPVCLNI